jgi:hypothetical protein
MGAVRTPVPAPDTADEVASAPQPVVQPITEGEENGDVSHSTEEYFDALESIPCYEHFKSLHVDVAWLVGEKGPTTTNVQLLSKFCKALGTLSKQQLQEIRTAIQAKRQKMASGEESLSLKLKLETVLLDPKKVLTDVIGRYLAHLNISDPSGWYAKICEEINNFIDNNPRSLDKLKWCDDEQDYGDTTTDVAKGKNGYDWMKALAKTGVVFPEKDNKGKKLEYAVTNDLYTEEIPAWFREYTFPEGTAKMAASQR